MGEYNEAIETRFDVKYANLDVDGRMIQERKLLGFYMEDEEFISEYTHVIEGKYLNRTDGVLHYDNGEDKYVGMGLSIRHGDEDDY